MKCIFAFDDNGDVFVRSIHPGVTENELRESTGCALPPMDIPMTEAPSPAERDILRRVVDPAGLLRTTGLVAPPASGP